MRESGRWPLPTAAPGASGELGADGGRAPGLRLEIATVAVPEGGTLSNVPEAFVVLGPRGRFSRTMLAEVVGPNGTPVREVALEIQSDEYVDVESRTWTNPDVDAAWMRQWRLWGKAAEVDAAPRLLDVLPVESADSPPQLPPTLFCKERQAYFVAPCPTCGAPLSTCRDDTVLSNNGLPPFTATLFRFLYCASCERDGKPGRFFSLIPFSSGASDAPRAAGQVDLYRGFAGLLETEAELPCVGCYNVPNCYPEDEGKYGDVIKLVTPLCFYDFYCLPVEPFHFSYEQFAALLGGCDWEDQASYSGTLPELSGTSSRRYLFEEDQAGKVALEIFRLKVTLFQQLTSAASRMHRAIGEPHLALSPRSAVVRLGQPAEDVPIFQSFSTRIVGVGSALPLRELRSAGADELAVPILEPSPLRDLSFVGNLDSEKVEEGVGRLLLRSIESQPGDLHCLSADLECSAPSDQSLCRGDVVSIAVRQARPLPISVDFLAKVESCEGALLSLRSLPLRLSGEALGQLQTLQVGSASIEANYRIFRCLQIPVDVQSLGLILFATLVANDRQSARQVTDAAKSLSASIVAYARDNPGATTEDLEAYAIEGIDRLRESGILATRNLYFDPDEHSDPTSHVPEVLWRGAFLLGLRALTLVAGFGFCRGRDDFDPIHPEGPADRLRAEIGVLTHKIDAELYGRSTVRRVYSSALARVREEMLK